MANTTEEAATNVNGGISGSMEGGAIAKTIEAAGGPKINITES